MPFSPFFVEHLTYIWKSNFDGIFLLGGELSMFLSPALSPPNFTLIGNDEFYMNLVLKSWCF